MSRGNVRMDCEQIKTVPIVSSETNDQNVGELLD